VLERSIREPDPVPDEDALESFRRSLPRRSSADLVKLARQQGAKPATRPEELLGNIWPEDESVDEFIETVRKWRRGR
jgi:hypothetical protein